MMYSVFPIALLAATAAGRPVTPAPKLRPMANPAPQTANFTPTATPATISFNAINPATEPTVAGSSTATISWTVSSTSISSWTLKIKANAAWFTNCSTVPLSAVTVSCASASIGGAGTATCSNPLALSTTAQQVAGGSLGSYGSHTYTVTINFTLADSWKYIAETSPACSLSLTYTANVP